MVDLDEAVSNFRGDLSLLGEPPDYIYGIRLVLLRGQHV